MMLVGRFLSYEYNEPTKTGNPTKMGEIRAKKEKVTVEIVLA